MIKETSPPLQLDKEERRAKREARRIRQRLENVTRAAKMHVERLHWEEKSPKRTVIKSPSKIHVGCSGWFYWHWRGGFYPAELPTSAWFKHYRSQFRTVELNAPFYAWPTVANVKTWLRQAGRADFIYTVKVSELITHVKQFTGTKGLVQDFGHIADLLGSHMGCFLFQLPPSFHYSRVRLKRIISQLDPTLRNVIEFRHKSWWNEEVYAAFKMAGIIFCSCSGPRLPDVLIKTAEEIYVRFHGPERWYRHDYSSDELEVWAERIKASGAERVWIYFNNDRDGYAIKNAKSLLRKLKVERQPLTPLS